MAVCFHNLVRNRAFRVCVFGLVMVLAVASGYARGKKQKEPERVFTVISNVSADAITIAEGKVMKTYAITPFTEILVKGQKASLASLQPGMLVGVTLGTDPTKAARINASDPPPEQPAKK